MRAERRFALAVVAVTLLGAAVRAGGIAEQPPLLDEVHMAFTAEGYVSTGQTEPSMPHHPSLRNLLIAASSRAFGPGALGLRFFSLVLGLLSVPVLALLVRQATGRDLAAVLAALLLALDPLHVAFSRQAIQEAHVTFFALAGAWLGLASLRRLERGERTWATDALLVLSGVAFGLGLASKLQAVFPLAVVVALLVRAAFRTRDPGRLALVVVALGAVPLTVLALTDAPWFARGYDLRDWAFMRTSLLHRMGSGFIPPAMERNPDRSAWEWFVKPLLGYASFSLSAGRPFVVVGMGNPLVWLAVLPAAAFTALSRRARSSAVVLQVLFWAAYVPFLFAGRPIFFLTALAAAPFAFGLVALAADELLASGRRRLVQAWAIAVVATSALLMPVATGGSLEHEHTAALVRRFDPARLAPSP